MGESKPATKSEKQARRLGALALLRRPGAVWRFLRDRNAPGFPRVVALFVIAYVIMPFDAIPDLAPIIGWLDDFGMTAAGLAFVASRAAKYENARLEAGEGATADSAALEPSEPRE